MSVYEQTFHVGDMGSNPIGDAKAQNAAESGSYETGVSAADGCKDGALTPISPQRSQSLSKRVLATRDGAHGDAGRSAEDRIAAKHERRLRRRGKSDAELFWDSVLRRADDECWEWTGRTAFGYGTLSFRKKQTKAHIVAYELAHGRAAELYVLHSCDNRRCCNPAHLREGTKAENSDDMMRRGRNADQRGEKNGNAKLTKKQVSAIRRKYRWGQRRREKYFNSPVRVTHVSLAKEYGVSEQAIKQVLNYRNWQDAPKNKKVYVATAQRPRMARFGEFTLPEVP